MREKLTVYLRNTPFFRYNKETGATMIHNLRNVLAILMGITCLSYGQAMATSVPYSAGGAGGAKKVADQTCDPDYWHSMTAKAWMEAEREIIQNKNLIYKPDSVMEYVCFDSFMQHSAKHVGNIFTHTKYFGGKEIIPRGRADISLEHTLTSAVTNSYKTYIQNNYSHKFLGERASKLGKGVTADRTLGDASAMGDYQCAIMANIWNSAKCENFIDNQSFESDGFFPFDDLTGGKNAAKGYKNIDDPRKFPTACAKPNNTAGNATWATAIPRATNVSDKLYDFSKPLKKTYDEIRPKLEPGKCSGAAANGILTGVTVITDASGKGGYDDGVCSNPGCSFKKNGKCAP